MACLAVVAFSLSSSVTTAASPHDLLSDLKKKSEAAKSYQCQTSMSSLGITWSTSHTAVRSMSNLCFRYVFEMEYISAGKTIPSHKTVICDGTHTFTTTLAHGVTTRVESLYSSVNDRLPTPEKITAETYVSLLLDDEVVYLREAKTNGVDCLFFRGHLGAGERGMGKAGMPALVAISKDTGLVTALQMQYEGHVISTYQLKNLSMEPKIPKQFFHPEANVTYTRWPPSTIDPKEGTLPNQSMDSDKE